MKNIGLPISTLWGAAMWLFLRKPLMFPKYALKTLQNIYILKPIKPYAFQDDKLFAFPVFRVEIGQVSPEIRH